MSVESATQRAARAVHARVRRTLDQADGGTSLAVVRRLEPLQAELAEEAELLTEGEDFELSAHLEMYGALPGVKVGDMLVVHQMNGGDWLATDVLTDTDLSSGFPGSGGDGSGESWFTGTGAPSAATGSVGDWYLEKVGGDYYEKTGETTWTARGNLKGPTGATGATGPQGATGATGSQGPTGAQGPVGPEGAVAVFEQAADPGAVDEGSLWIETDVTVGYGPMWAKVTQAQYDALSPPDPNTLYLVVG